MARKKEKPTTAEPENFKKEKEEKVEIGQLIQDERTRKIAGSFCMLFSLLLFISFTSYLFTWDEDQDLVFQKGGSLFWGGDNDEIRNLMGTFGAIISHFFFYKGFGLASYMVCTACFIAGINLFFERQVFSLTRNLKYLLTGMPLLSIMLSVLTNGSEFPWGGQVGDISRDWSYRMIGQLGTIAILAVVGFSYVIWQFNPSFRLPSKQSVNPGEDVLDPQEESLSDKIDFDIDEQGEEAEKKPSRNRLKKEMPVKVNPIPEVLQESELKLVEKPEPPAAPIVELKPEAPIESLQKKSKQITETPALEIKTAESENKDQDIDPASKVLQSAPYDPILDLRDYKFPTIDLLENHGSEKIVQDTNELENNKNQIITTLGNYDISIQKISATVGPTVTLYEIIPAAGVRISRIKNLEDDIALSLSALGIRIIAPIPGKGTIGIEVPNAKKTIVSMRTLLSSEKFLKNNYSLPIALGKKIDNENFIVDLATMPHLLMAGATGQGKSVGLNAVLVSLLYKKHPSQLKFVLVDPKKVELSIYRSIQNHFLAKLPGEEDAIITDTKKVIHTLNALCIEMDNRYDLLKEAGCRNIREYNEKFVGRKLNPEKGHQFLPFIVLVVDEFADLIMTAGKEVEMPITRLAQLARAVGIHLIIATQRPSVNIITGTIKANFPARIAFKVSSKIDSRTILDQGGAEQLIGKGDMLISYGGEVVRLQCAFVDTPEVDKIVDFISDQRGYPQAFLLPEYVDEKEMESRSDFDAADKDPLFEDAARLIVASQMGSTSLLQRRMKLGYNRAGRLMDQLEAAGIVGPGQGSKPRDVLVKTDADLQQMLNGMI
jgi:S-DNA-T family DNA segregation ATPase FtsK/SpoIIIE